MMFTKQVTIRAMRKSDAKNVSKMIKTLAAHFGDKAKVTERDLLFYCFGKNRLSKIALAFIDERPVGYAISREWMNFNAGFKLQHIDALYVDDKHRRAGTGKALLGFIAADALKSGCKRLTLGVSPKNEAARKLYLNLGFENSSNNFDQFRLPHAALIKLARNKDEEK